MNKIIFIIFFASLILASDEIHLIAEGSAGYKALTSSNMQNRLREAANYYTQQKKASRIGLFDMAYPVDSIEYNRMNGFGILWVTVLTLDSSELPVKVTIQGSDDNRLNLVPLRLFRTTEKDRQITRSLGKHRLDGIYLVPLITGTQGATLLIDFAQARKGFVLGTMEKEFPAELGELSDEMMDIPEQMNIEPMLLREYPIYKKITTSDKTEEK